MSSTAPARTESGTGKAASETAARARAVADSYARAGKALKVLLAVAIVLLATHKGEFWPFSIFPMFSKAGRPFTRSVVRELAPGETYARTPQTLASLPGRPFPLQPVDIAQNDVASMVSASGPWTPERVESARRLFASQLAAHRLLVLSAQGAPSERGVDVTFRPLLELSSQGAKVLVP